MQSQSVIYGPSSGPHDERQVPSRPDNKAQVDLYLLMNLIDFPSRLIPLVRRWQCGRKLIFLRPPGSNFSMGSTGLGFACGQPLREIKRLRN